ncbi:MAG TPA: TRAP transporter TatT component family protein [Kofleriaceae bacterium]|nr:TRAP transporter TatT component family protein [Kofleriaceae bacterium]
MGAFTVNTTTKVLVRAQPSLQQESDYDLAARALPGTLKTVEGFWVVNPENDDLTGILMEGYCQYGSGFVEDEWEDAQVRKDFDGMEYQSERATKMYLRCMNYALRLLGDDWQAHIFGTTDEVNNLVAHADSDKRDALMWAAVGLASAINMNKDKMDLVAQLPTAKAMLLKVIEMDSHSMPDDKIHAALPHVAMGMLYSATGKDLGGDVGKATEEFKKANDLTGGKFLLAQVFYARKVGVMSQDKKLFHDTLVKVLETPASIWPEQRLAGEIAHRRARRYLKQEKELF